MSSEPEERDLHVLYRNIKKFFVRRGRTLVEYNYTPLPVYGLSMSVNEVRRNICITEEGIGKELKFQVAINIIVIKSGMR
jgi:hypothetical protein